MAAVPAAVTTSDTGGSDLSNTTPKKSSANGNQQYIGSNGGGDGGGGIQQQFISTSINGAQYYQPSAGYQTFDAAFEQPSMFMPTYGNIDFIWFIGRTSL